jgi:hypothetical protein
MSLDWIFWAIGIWFLIGAVCAGLVYQDQVDRKAKGWKWPLLCIPLSVIGYYLYHSEKRKVRPTARELPPRQHYPAPEYQFKELPPEPVEAKTETDPMTPTAAVSSTASSTVQEEPVAEPLAPPPVEKDNRTAEERVDPSRPKVQQIEGIPRCGSCGAAVSSYDVACNNCGAPLKP